MCSPYSGLWWLVDHIPMDYILKFDTVYLNTTYFRSYTSCITNIIFL